ncbi:MAG: 6-carboxytetrahydropterin synthase QueD [Spirochaetales bacterium]|nr:6-carboxytetrahydropterin synthase QueD [Spirochaetales bacterium]
MYHIRVEDSFAAAHFISDYHGKCERLHGHNYRVRVHAAGDTLTEGGMLIDFGVLKKALKEVLSGIDHTHLNEHPAFTHGNPSAEHIAEYIYAELESRLPAAPLNRVEVFETEKNMAAYTKS